MLIKIVTVLAVLATAIISAASPVRDAGVDRSGSPTEARPAPQTESIPHVDGATPTADIAGCRLVKSQTYPIGLYLCDTPTPAAQTGYPAP